MLAKNIMQQQDLKTVTISPRKKNGARGSISSSNISWEFRSRKCTSASMWRMGGWYQDLSISQIASLPKHSTTFYSRAEIQKNKIKQK